MAICRSPAGGAMMLKGWLPSCSPIEVVAVDDQLAARVNEDSRAALLPREIVRSAHLNHLQ